MYGYIQKAQYCKLLVDKNTFNRLYNNSSINKRWELNHPPIEIILNNNPKCQKALSIKNEFIRIVCGNWYMDFSIVKVIAQNEFKIYLGNVIDHTTKITSTKTIK